jgi:malate/lactate dehydrogenase
LSVQGFVGTIAFDAWMLRVLVGEMALLEINVALADPAATDVADADALACPTHIWAEIYNYSATVHIVVITVRATTHDDESRLLDQLRSAAISGTSIESLKAVKPYICRDQRCA